MYLVAGLGNLAASRKVVGIEGQWTGAYYAIVWCASGGISIVARHTLLTVVASRRMLAVLADARGTVAGVGMAIALAGYAIATIRSILITIIARCAILARVAGITRRAVAVLDGQELVLACTIGILVGQRQIDIG